MINRADINPKMMHWARIRAGFNNGFENHLPSEIKTRYKKWETGDVKPTWNQLRTVSKKYDLPTAFFFMESPPDFDEFPELINYRKLDSNSPYIGNSPYLIKNIRECEIKRSIYIELLNELNEKTIKFNTNNLTQNKKVFSRYIRDILGVSLDCQKSWVNDPKHYSTLNKWKEIITSKLGILIFESKNVNISEMRGLCIFHEEVPIILLNGKDQPNGRIFTLFHELTHLILGESAICGDDIDRDIEIFCNSVAGEFLVPEDDLIKNFDNNLSDSKLKYLSNLYGVSEYVILKRLLDTNKINKSDYDLKTSNIYINNSNSSNKGNYYKNLIKYNGKPFYTVVLEAYDLGIINSLEFSKFTNLSLKQIPKIQDLI